MIPQSHMQSDLLMREKKKLQIFLSCLLKSKKITSAQPAELENWCPLWRKHVVAHKDSFASQQNFIRTWERKLFFCGSAVEVTVMLDLHWQPLITVTQATTWRRSFSKESVTSISRKHITYPTNLTPLLQLLYDYFRCRGLNQHRGEKEKKTQKKNNRSRAELFSPPECRVAKPKTDDVFAAKHFQGVTRQLWRPLVYFSGD